MDILPNWVIISIISLFGLALGSFVTALSWRLPRGISILKQNNKNEDTSSMRSFCPKCKQTLNVIDLIPIFSWIFFKGKCRQCKAPISIRYPLTELVTALLCVVFYLFIPEMKNNLELIILFMCLSVTLITTIVIDLEHKIIPNSLNFTIALLGAVFIFLTSDNHILIDNLQSALLHMFGYTAFIMMIRYSFLYFMKRDALGLGDVKFFAATGFWLDINLFPIFLFAAGISGIVIGLTWTKITGDKKFPFGPALILALIICLCLPENISQSFL